MTPRGGEGLFRVWAPPRAPAWGNRFTRAIGNIALRIAGWRIEGEVPDVPKLVAIAAPHTCTLDVFVAIAVLLSLGLRVRWFAKHTIFVGPVGTLLRWLGGTPIDRRGSHGVVSAAVALLKSSGAVYLALAPEGTRRKVERWKSGFYQIAVAAEVPIVPVALDYSRHVVTIGGCYRPTGQYQADLIELRRHFTAQMARHPERY